MPTSPGRRDQARPAARRRRVDARARRATVGPTSAVSQGGRAAGGVQQRAPARPARRVGVFAKGPAQEGQRRTTDAVGARRASQRREQARERRYRPTHREPVVPLIRNPTPAQRRAVVRAYARAGQRDPNIRRQVSRAGVSGRGNEGLRNHLYASAYTNKLLRQGAPWRYTLPMQVEQARAVVGSTPSRAYVGSRPEKHGAARVFNLATLPARKAFLAVPRRFTSQLGQVTSPQGVGGRVAVNTVKDLFNLPGAAVASLYYTAAAGAEAALGRPQRAKQLWREFVEGDPLALAAQGRFAEAGNAAVEHPVATGLELWGAKGAVGRGLGRAGRAPQIFGREPARWADMRRPSRVLEGTTLDQRQSYSPDVFERAVQVRRDRRRVARADRLYGKAAQNFAEGNVERGKVQMRAATQLRQVSDDEVRRRMDETVAAVEDTRRGHRAQVVGSVKPAVLPRRRGGHLVALVAQRIVRATPEDLRAYRGELEAQHRSGALNAGQARANAKLRREIDRALKSRKLDLPAVERAAAEFVRVTGPQQRALVEAGMLDAAQAERARLIPYAVRNMGAQHDPDQGIVDQVGAPLTNEAIRAHMEAHGVPEPAFVTQAPSMRGGGNFFRSFFPRPGLRTEGRTGAATLKGTFDADPQVLVEQAARAQGLVDADAGFKRAIDEYGFRDRDGDLVQFANYKGAADFARRLADQTGRGWRAVRVNPWGGSRAQLQALLDETGGADVDLTQLEGSPIVKALEDAISDQGGEGPWAVWPDAAASQLHLHLKQLGPGPAGKVFQKISGSFRNAVLPLSTKWLTGNVVEAALRVGLERAGPRSWYVGRKVMQEAERLDPVEAEQLLNRATRGGHYSFAERQSIHRGAEQFADAGPVLRNLARALGAFWRTPGPKQVSEAWKFFTHHVFETINGGYERQTQTALSGRYARENLMDGHAIRTSQKAIEQAARGLLNTNDQVAMGRYVDKAYGKYSKFSPGQRHLITNYTPFAAWWLNAVRFVLSTLPKEHPVAVGLLASAHQATEEWRKEHGLDLFGDGAVPGFLQGSIPVGDSKLRIARYLPFGAFGDPAGTIAEQVLPQFSGPLAALAGKDWRGRDLKVNGRPAQPHERFLLAMRSFVESTVPGVAPGTRIATGDGGLPGRLRKEFDPFRAVPPAASQATNGGSSGDGGGWRVVGGGSAEPAAPAGGGWRVVP